MERISSSAGRETSSIASINVLPASPDAAASSFVSSAAYEKIPAGDVKAGMQTDPVMISPHSIRIEMRLSDLRFFLIWLVYSVYAAGIHQMFTQRNRVADILCDKISLYTAAMQFTDKHYLTKSTCFMKKEHKSRKRLIIGFLFAALITADVIMWAGHIGTLTPYAISYEDQEICRVRNKETASRVLSSVFEDMAQDDTSIAAISSDFHIEKGGSGEIVSEEEAKDAVIASAEETDANIKIASSRTKLESYTPDPDYKKNTEMLAGDAEVISEGESGQKEVGVTYTTVNGKVEDKDKTDIDITQEGVPAVIEKGTLGLPSGETWEEYDGEPVANSGEDVITLAKQYLGLRYVWGGKNLETGVDCSGFVIALYRKYGLNLNYPLYKEGTGVSYNEAQAGDLLYFPGHYGLYIGDGKMIHASNYNTGVIISNVGNRKILAVRRLVSED